MKIYLMFFAGGVVLVAGLMEIYKAGAQETKKRITIYSIILALVVSISIFFGVDHIGNVWTYPLWGLALWYLQKVLDMKVIRAILKKIIEGYGKQKGVDLTDSSFIGDPNGKDKK